MALNNWSPLDLRKRSTLGPFDDELIALHLIPKNGNYGERFVVVRPMTEEGKTWFIQPSHISGLDAAKLRKHYIVEWAHLPTPQKRP